MNGALPDAGSRRTLAVALLVAGVLLAAFGFLTLLTIGIVVLPVGIAMIVAASFSDRPPVLAGITMGAVAFSVAYALTAPWGCLQTFPADGGTAVTTRCSRIALPDLHRLSVPGDTALALIHLLRA